MIQHIATGAALALALSYPARAQEPLPAPLLLPVEAPSAGLPVADVVTMQSGPVAVRVELLADAAAGSGTVALSGVAGEAWRLERVTAEPAFEDGIVYRADVVDGDAEVRGEALLSVVGEAVTGSVRIDRRLLRIESAGPGAHRVVEVDESAFAPCGTHGERHRVVTGSAGRATGASKMAANAPTVDMLVVYTTQAKNAQGSTNAIKSLINLAVTETNDAYGFVDVNQRLRLVHTAELSGYTEAPDFSTMLGTLRNKNDGVIDEVHGWRDTYGADAVAMIVAGGQYCGIAYLMGNPGPNFESSAFSVTARSCATGYYSFGHELGHNFGSQHDAANAGGSPAYSYSYGWRTANGAFRTIMAYAPGSRIKRFSNPNKTFNGQVLGQTGSAENWKSLNNTAPFVSQWRCAVPEVYGTPKFSSIGSFPSIGSTGKPIANGSGNFEITVSDAVPGNSAIVFYGFASGQTPFQGGNLWVASPITRLGLQVLDGSGAASWDFPITQFAPGDELYVQGWFRDPNNVDGTGTGLTDALRVDVCEFDN